MDKPRVVLTRQWTPAVEQALAENFDLRDNPRDALLSEEEMLARCDGARYFCPTSTDAISTKFLAALPSSVKLIASYGAGVNHIDLEAARARSILVTNTPGVVTEDTADLTFGLMIAACRRFAEGNALAKSGTWSGFGVNFMLGVRVWGQTLGIVGMGNIGGGRGAARQGFRHDGALSQSATQARNRSGNERGLLRIIGGVARARRHRFAALPAYGRYASPD